MTTKEQAAKQIAYGIKLRRISKLMKIEKCA